MSEQNKPKIEENKDIDAMTKKALDDFSNLGEGIQKIADDLVVNVPGGIRIINSRLTEEEKMTILAEIERLKAVYGSISKIDDRLQNDE